MNKLSLEQVRQRLIPVLQQVSMVFMLDSIGKERERWNYVHKELGSLFLDIQTSETESQPIGDERFMQLIRDKFDSSKDLVTTEERLIMFLMLKQVETLQGLFAIVENIQMQINTLATNSNDEWNKRNNT